MDTFTNFKKLINIRKQTAEKGNVDKIFVHFCKALDKSLTIETIAKAEIEFDDQNLVALEAELWKTPEYRRCFCEMFPLINERQSLVKSEPKATH